MSGFITEAGENYLLDLITGTGYTLPYYYVALVRAKPPTRNITGSELDEPNQGEYTRAAYQNVSGNWTERKVSVSNIEPIVFPVCASEWGLISHWALTDQIAGGRVLWAGTLQVPSFVSAADQVVLSPGSLTLRAMGYSTGVML